MFNWRTGDKKTGSAPKNDAPSKDTLLARRYKEGYTEGRSALKEELRNKIGALPRYAIDDVRLVDISQVLDLLYDD